MHLFHVVDTKIIYILLSELFSKKKKHTSEYDEFVLISTAHTLKYDEASENFKHLFCHRPYSTMVDI